MAASLKNRDKMLAEAKMKDLNVTESELKSLKKNAKVYYQQPNSCIFFLSNKDKELANVADKKAELKTKMELKS